MLGKKCAEAVCGDISDDFRYVGLDMEDVAKDSSLLVSEFYAQSLMGGRRAIVVKNANNNLADVIKKTVPESVSENVMIIMSATLNTKSSLISWAKNREDVIIVGCYEDREEDIIVSAQNMLRTSGVYIGQEALGVLGARLSPDRKINQGEIEKLLTYIGDNKEVSVADVQAVVSDVAGANFEDLCHFTALGETLKAGAIYNRLVFEGEAPATLIRQITYHFSKLLNFVAAMEKGEKADQVINAYRPQIIYFRKPAFIEQLRLWNRNRILSVLELLYECERDCKTTSYPAEQLVSYTILRIAGAANKFKRI